MRHASACPSRTSCGDTRVMYSVFLGVRIHGPGAAQEPSGCGKTLDEYALNTPSSQGEL